MKSDFIQTRRGRFHFFRWGTGEEVLLAFHGFGHRAERFQVLAQGLGDHCTVYAVDLPMHGLSQWALPEFMPVDLLELIDNLQRQEGFSKFWGLGHSLGGRLWLSLLPQVAEHLQGLLLIAPDGFRTRGLGLAMALPPGLRESIARKMQQPDAWLQMAQWAQKAKVLNKRHYRFVKQHLEDQNKREKMIRTWLSMRHFPIREDLIKQACQEYDLPIHILLGRNDPFVHARRLTRIVSQWPCTQIDYTEEGHLPRTEVEQDWIRKILAPGGKGG